MMLTQEQRASRRTHKYNNRVAAELPLFAGTAAIQPFLADERDELERVKKWDEIADNYIKHLHECDQEWSLKAALLRDQVADRCPDEIAQWDADLERLMSHYPAFQNDPVYVADYWRGKLKGQ